MSNNIKKWQIEKYPNIDGFHYVAVCKDTGKELNDHMNHGGHLTTHIKKHFNVKIPTLYFRRKYYVDTGDYWWEQYFDIVKRENPTTKKCPYCDWETIDVENLSGVFEQHLNNVHSITRDKYLIEYPEDKNYFKYNKRQLRQKENNKNNYIKCSVCGEKLKIINDKHLNKHNMSVAEYKLKYGEDTLSKNYKQHMADRMVELNKSGVMFTKESKSEKELVDFLKSKNISVIENDRSILSDGKEIDILLPEHKLGIEFNGNIWHTEFFGGKDKNYHLNKTIELNNKGYNLIQIFEDEYMNDKNLILDKLSHILNLKKGNKIYARKTIIKEIDNVQSRDFLNENHIQGNGQSWLSLGAYYEDELVAVMTFKRVNVMTNSFDLTRFATKKGYNVIGIGSKLFKTFLNNYKPSSIISFADRRWTLNKDDNLYIKLGFKLVSIVPPQYRYYNNKIHRYERFHKFNFRKKTLNKKYGLPLSMTETEMIKELGYDRIWDCGLFKYEFLN